MTDRYRAALETVAQWDEWAAQRLRELEIQPVAPAEDTRYNPTHVHDGEWCAACVEHGRAAPADFTTEIYKENRGE